MTLFLQTKAKGVSMSRIQDDAASARGGGGSEPSSGRSSRRSGATGSSTPVPPPLRFELDGDDVPTKGDLRIWCKASHEERDYLERRVQRLKQEEAAALKKLRETEERSSTLENQKQAQTARRAEHERHRENVLRTQHRERTLVALARQRESRALVASKTLVQLEKKERVMSARRDHAVHELVVLSQQEARRERLRSQKTAIKEAQQRWRDERGQEMARKRKERYRNELEGLMNEREGHVNCSAKLVTEEAAMMLRLHAIKQKNASALSKLSSIIGTSSRCSDDGDGTNEDTKLPPL